MLSDLEVGQFWTFGFTILKGCLSEKEVECLQETHSRVIAEAPVYNYFAENSTRMLGPFVQADDTFADLIEHPGVMEAMRDIWGTECLYIAGSDMWVNRDDTPWHTDGQPGRHTITLKTAIYLDEQSKDFGSLNLIPGSHHPEYSAALFRSCGYWDKGRPRLRLNPHAIPGTVSVQTRPGDVVLWDNRLWHSAFKRKDGRPRRTMFIGYMPDPQDDLLAIKDLRTTVEAHLNEGQPFVYSKEMMEKGNARREKMAARLEELGVERVREQ